MRAKKISARRRIPKINSMCSEAARTMSGRGFGFDYETDAVRSRVRETSSSRSSRVKLDVLLDDVVDQDTRRRGDASEINIVSKVSERSAAKHFAYNFLMCDQL